MNFLFSGAALPLLLVLGCGGGDGSAEGLAVIAQESPDQGQDAPAPAPEPEPLMRRPIHCCSDLVFENALKSYLSIGTALASGELTAIEADRAALAEQLTQLGEDHALASMVEVVGELEACELDACRESFAVLSKALVAAIGDTHSGDLDIAVAWSRKHESPWIQEGNELHSPYGDGIESFAWGDGDEVRGADKVRETKRGEGKNTRPSPEAAPPVEADPPEGTEAPPPKEDPGEGA